MGVCMRHYLSGLFLSIAIVGNGLAAELRNIIVPTAPALQVASAKILPGTPNMPVGATAGIARNSRGHYFIYQRTTHALIEFDQEDRIVRDFPNVPTKRAHGLRIDSADNLWLVDVADHTVTNVAPSGEILMVLGTKGQAGTWNESAGTHMFNQPTDIAFGANGDIFVATGHGGPDPRIVRFDKSGKFLKTWSLAHEGIPANIHTIVIDKNGTIYAGDRDVMMIRVFDADGQNLRNIKMSNLVCGLYIDPKGNLWMAAGMDGMIMRLDWSGKILAWTGKLGKAANEYGEAHYMAMTEDLKTIYVTDPVNPSAHKISLAKAFE